VSSPADDERILEAAERIDGLSESEQEAALAALAPSDREQVVLTMFTNATMVEELTSVLGDALAPEAAERYAEALRTLSWRVLRVARAGAQSEIQAAIDELVAEHPELQEQAETVAVFLFTREG
jgi:citrate lyase beta subunit